MVKEDVLVDLLLTLNSKTIGVCHQMARKIILSFH